MKRLDQLLDQTPAGFAKRYQALNALSTEEFRELLYKYKKLGIPYEFLAIPWLLESDRASYEFFLRQTPAGRARVAPEARRLKKVMKAAEQPHLCFNL
jgi:hypothetical protein